VRDAVLREDHRGGLWTQGHEGVDRLPGGLGSLRGQVEEMAGGRGRVCHVDPNGFEETLVLCQDLFARHQRDGYLPAGHAVGGRVIAEARFPGAEGKGIP
jgi:hypothetical protein